MRTLLISLLALLTTACGPNDDAASVEGATPEETRQLDNAAEMLDTSADNLALPVDNAVERR